MPSSRLLIDDVVDNYSVLELELPPIVERALWALTALQYAPPCDSPLDHQLRGPLFRATTPSPVLAIGLFAALWDGPPGADEFHFDLLVPAPAVHAWLADALAARARGERAAPVPWRTLVRASRLFDVTSSRDTAVCGAWHASTGFTKLRNDAGEHYTQEVVVLHHFDARHAIARDLAREPRLGRGSRRIPRQACLTEPETVVDEQVWAEPMEMGAWVRQVWTDIPVEEGEEIMLFEDGLAIRTPEKQLLTVYTI
ncbi:hypothetical protein PsYK624_103340 [Phanerochaete sordida]|uniref:Uncharacterized protein n=1 Tax=Phanerochaete sordida TaxID=48140 RepID=A0A9P3LG36_9APHY|nr:hypothetical protein PsYK624_103340 [Phanerochaete sordida]